MAWVTTRAPTYNAYVYAPLPLMASTTARASNGGLRRSPQRVPGDPRVRSSSSLKETAFSCLYIYRIKYKMQVRTCRAWLTNCPGVLTKCQKAIRNRWDLRSCLNLLVSITATPSWIVDWTFHSNPARSDAPGEVTSPSNAAVNQHWTQQQSWVGDWSITTHTHTVANHSVCHSVITAISTSDRLYRKTAQSLSTFV